jgi:hypothetical protein
MPFKNLRRFAQREHQRFRAIRRLHATLASLSLDSIMIRPRGSVS